MQSGCGVSASNRFIHLAVVILFAAWTAPTALGCSCAVTATARLLVTTAGGAPPPPTPEELRIRAIYANTQRLQVKADMDRQEYIPRQNAEFRIAITNPTDGRLEVWRQYLTDSAAYIDSLGCYCGGVDDELRETQWFEPGETIERTYRSSPSTFLISASLGNHRLFHSSLPVPIEFRVIPGQPTLSSVPGNGRQGAIRHAMRGGGIASPADPASVGEALEIYGTGLLFGCTEPRRLLVSGVPAQILYYGTSGGLGGLGALDQVNIRVPAGITSGSEIPVQLHCGNGMSNEVTIGVK